MTLIRGIFLAAEDNVRQKAKNYGITVTSFRTLWILFFEPKMSMTELAYISQTNISNTYRQLIKLRDQNYVVIDEKEEDARIKQVELTENGRKFIEEILSRNIEASELNFISILAKIPTEQLSTFIQVASKITTELIGPKFNDWAYKAANTIKDS